jgi:hypothetical protein
VTTTTTYRLDLPRWDTAWEVKTRRGVPVLDKRARKPVRVRKVWDVLTGNARIGHWSQRHAAVKEVIEAVAWTAKAARVPAGSHLSVRLVWAPGDNRRADPDLLDPLRKVCIDALARGPRKDLPGLHLVPDDGAEWVTRQPSRIDRPPAPPGLWLELEVRA